MLRFPLFAAAGLLSLAGETYESPEFGFRLEVPAGWVHQILEEGEGSLHLALSPAAAANHVQLSVRAQKESALGDPESVRRLVEEAAAAEARYTNVVRTAGVVAGRAAPGLALDVAGEAVPLHLRQLYAAEAGFVYILQTVAPPADFAGEEGGYAAIWSTFAFVPLSSARVAMRRLEELAARCGSEIAWAASWPEAAERARERRCLVLVYARIYPGFVLTDEVMGGLFMAPEIVELVNERYVPFHLGADLDVPFRDPELYGLSGSTFGVAALLVTPEGRVVREGRAPTYDFLCEGLAADPDHPGPPAPRATEHQEKIAILLRRGELAAAAKLLAAPRTAAHFRLRAELHRRLRRGEEALADLRAARAAPGGEELAADLDAAEGEVLLALGRLAEGEALLARIAAADPPSPRAPETLFRLGEVRRLTAGRAAAEECWQRLVAEEPASRWAWQAAATLVSTTYALDRGARLDWPAAEYWAELAIPPYEPVPATRASQAERDAVAFLLAHQRPTGEWISTTELGALPGDPPDDFQLAVTALCAQALLPHRERSGAAEAVERALGWLLLAYERARTAAEPPFLMDYGVWSRSCLLWFLADAAAAGRRERAALEEPVAHLLEELAAKQKPGGGWSYYVSRDLDGVANPATESISFTTAAVVLSLLRAREAGFAVPAEVLERGLDCLTAMRNEEGTFEYMLSPGARAAAPGMAAAGAAGRGPACTLALARGGRAG
ncbi:MAG: hypothetical protein AB1726_03640, partial [Planctomycetota bacterium]